MIIIENNKVAAEKLINKSTKLKDLEKTEYFQKFYDLDPTSKRYPDNPKFLLTLIKWFLEDPVERQYNLIKVEFETYLEQVRLNHWKGADVVIKDIAKFPKFPDFATEVHRITAKYRKSDSQEQSDEVKDLGSKIEVLGKKLDKKDVTLQKDDVVVVRADTMQKSIEYGSGFSDWCTARHSNNYFYEYRFGNYGNIGESTMYYVYFPKRYTKNPNDDEAVLNFGVNDDGQISYTNRSNNESVESLSWLQEHFEEFDGVNMGEVFPHKPITDSEKKISNLADDMSDEDFYNLSNEDKLMYLQSSSDRVINLNKFKSMSDDLKSSYLGIVENSGSQLDRAVLYLIRNTAFGRRYIKNMSDLMVENLTNDLSNSNHRIFRDRQKAIEIIDLIIENKKDTISPRALYDVLCASYAYGDSFDEKTFLSTVNKFGRTTLSTLSSLNIRFLITDFAYKNRLPLIEDVLGKEIISKLTRNNVHDILENVERNASRFPSQAVDLVNFVLEYFSDVDAIVANLLSTTNTLSKSRGTSDSVDFNSIKLRLIDSRKVFSSEFVTNILHYSYDKSKILTYIGDRFDINNLNNSDIVRLFTEYLPEEPSRVVDLENAISSVLPKLTDREIHSILSDITSSTIRFDIVDLLIKYTIKNWQSYSLQVLLENVAKTNDEKIRYINIIGRDYLNRMLTKDNLLAILSSSSDPVSIIELLGKESILSKIEIWGFKSILQQLIGKRNKIEGSDDKLVSFIVNNFQLDSEDIVFLFQSTTRPQALANLIGSVNFEKLSTGDIISIINNRYIDSVVQDNMLELFKNKILKFTPEQINLLLDYSTNALPTIVNFLSVNNYDFTNKQIVTILHHVLIFARRNTKDVNNVLTNYVEKIGVDKIKNLDNFSIILLLARGFNNIEFLLRYVPINSLNGDVIEKMLTTAHKNSYGTGGDGRYFDRVFEKLESVLNKLSEVNSDTIVNLMSTGYEPATKLFDYLVKKNPSMLTPSLILSFLRSLINNKVFKNTLSAPEILKQIGTEKINSALDALSESGINALIDQNTNAGYTGSQFSLHVVHALLSIMSPSNMNKINDGVFSSLTRSFGFTSGRKDAEFSVFLKKPNLTNSNIGYLIQYAPDDYYKYNLLDSIKPQLNKLTPDELVKPLMASYFYNITTPRLVEIVNFYGKTNTDRLTGDQIFNVLRQIRYDATEEIMFKLLLSFGENLYKLTNDQIELLYDNLVNPNKIGKYAIEMATFCKTKKMSEKFINQIRESDYTFLQDFTGLYFKNFNDVTDYLRVIAQYIKTHNNTLTFPEFVGIVDEVERGRSVRNAVLTFLSKVLKGTFKTYWKKYQDLFKHNNKPVTEYKRFYSDLLLENSSFSQENLEKALDIERKAYPPHMQLINSYIEQGGTLDIYDIADYLECEIGDIVFHMGSNWFIIGCVDGNELEIADWASDGGMSPNAIKAFFGVLRQYKDKTISCSARETTSYSLIKKAERVGYVTVLEEEAWNWGGVKMVDMKFKFNDDFMNRLGKK